MILRAEIHFYHVKLYLYGKKSVGKLVYYPIIESWSDGVVSIKTLPGFNFKLKVISKWPTKEGWHIIDITEIVKKWHDSSIPNYGIYCHSQDTESTCVSKFISLEGSPKKLRPKLVKECK